MFIERLILCIDSHLRSVTPLAIDNKFREHDTLCGRHNETMVPGMSQVLALLDSAECSRLLSPADQPGVADDY